MGEQATGLRAPASPRKRDAAAEHAIQEEGEHSSKGGDRRRYAQLRFPATRQAAERRSRLDHDEGARKGPWQGLRHNFRTLGRHRQISERRTRISRTCNRWLPDAKICPPPSNCLGGSCWYLARFGGICRHPVAGTTTN